MLGYEDEASTVAEYCDRGLRPLVELYALLLPLSLSGFSNGSASWLT